MLKIILCLLPLFLCADYQYVYDASGRVIEAIDKVGGTKVTRTYDAAGNLVHETLPTGIQVSFARGENDLQLTLPDASKILYEYASGKPSRVVRIAASGERLYEHTYTYENGRIAAETLAAGVGTITYDYDGHGRLIGSKTPAGEERVTAFHPNGHIAEMRRFSGTYRFQYDEKGQITREEGPYLHTYNYDREGNRALLCQKENLSFVYDDLGRVIEIHNHGKKSLSFTYDGFHRKMSETSWETGQTRHFIYAGPYEIGSVGQELRILGHRLESDIGATIAIEREGQLFIPIHDLCSNIAALLSARDGSVVERYTFTAFQEEECPAHPLSPWRFSDKRSVLSLVDFGRRLYDPASGRWLSPDPLGDLDGPNLYTYAHNNPLLFSDPNGCESLFSSLCAWAGKVVQQYSYHVMTFPPLREAGIYLGELLGAPPIFRSNRPSHFGSVGEKSPGYPHISVWINGLNTDCHHTVSYAQSISDACGGEKVYYIFNSTDGFNADLWAYWAGKFYLPQHAPKVAADGIRAAIGELGGVNAGGTVTIFAHSNGAQILGQALLQLSDKEKGMLEIYTFGNPSPFICESARKITHFLCSRDWISILVDPIQCARFYLWHSDIFQLCPSDEGGLLINHSIAGPTYVKEISRIGLEIQEKYRMYKPPGT